MMAFVERNVPYFLRKNPEDYKKSIIIATKSLSGNFGNGETRVGRRDGVGCRKHPGTDAYHLP